MPNISAHMIVAKKVGERLNIYTRDFIRGNLLPDIILSKDSHHKIESKVYLVPDIEYHLDNLDLSNDLNLGYLVHLMLDKYFLEDYLDSIYPNQNIYLDNLIYTDYDYLNYDLVKFFELDTRYLSEVLQEFNCNIDKEKLKYNIECLIQYTPGITRYIDYESFITFLKDISEVISKELYSYADKYKKLSLRIR